MLTAVDTTSPPIQLLCFGLDLAKIQNCKQNLHRMELFWVFLFFFLERREATEKKYVSLLCIKGSAFFPIRCFQCCVCHHILYPHSQEARLKFDFGSIYSENEITLGRAETVIREIWSLDKGKIVREQV